MTELWAEIAKYPWLEVLVKLVLLCLAAWVSHLMVRLVALRGLRAAAAKTRFTWDDVLVQRNVFGRLAWIVPVLVLSYAGELFPVAAEYAERLVNVLAILVAVFTMDALLSAVVDVYQTRELSRRRPLKGFAQLVKLLVWIMAGVAGVALIMGESPWKLLSGIGAFTAVLLLVFKDTILSFVGGLQLTGSDIIRKGDWLESPSHGADGDVVDIALHTVKVRNWDNTIVSIPTYQLTQTAFKNWRGMSESGGRRIKRSLILDQSSVRFVNEKMLESLRGVERLQSYLVTKEEDIASWNAAREVNTDHPLNGRRMTNIGCFRAYILAYLKEHPQIRDDMTFIVRQLAPTKEGLPLEIYVFSADTVWEHYEAIQSDIFDHLLAAMSWFGLRVYQRGLGADKRVPEELAE